MGSFWVVSAFLLVAVGVSGCAGGDKLGAESAPTTAADPMVSADAGSISGTVVDAELRPVAGVNAYILEIPDRSAASDAEGKFTFNEIAPGSYSLVLQKLGYESAARKVQVSAAEVTNFQITLTALAVSEPYVESYTYKAFMSVGASTPVITARPGILLDDKLIFDTNVTTGVSTVVSAMQWDSSAPLTAKKMRLDVIVDGKKANETNAASPLVNTVDGIKTKEKSVLQHSIWIPFTGTDDPTSAFVVVFQQSFNLYVTVFYGGPAPAGFTGLPA